MSSIGDLVVKLQADTSDFQRGMRRSQSELRGFAATATRLAKVAATTGLAALGAVAVKTAQQFSRLDKIGKTADKLGLTTEAVAGLGFAFEQTGVDANAGMVAIQRMTRRIADAANGTGPAVKALQELGLSASELNTMSPDRALASIANAMQGVESQSDRVRLAFSLFDSEGVGLVNTLAGGAAGLAAFQREAENLNLAHTREEIARIEAANDAMNRVTAVFTGAFQNLAIVAAPVIESIADSVTALTKDVYELASAIGSVFGLNEVTTAAQAAYFASSITADELGKLHVPAQPVDNLVAIAAAAKEAEKEAKRLEQNKQRNAKHFTDHLADVKRALRVNLGLMTEIDAEIERQSKAGVSQERLNELRQVLEAQKQLDDAKSASQPSRFAGFAAKRSTEAFKIIANANKTDKLESIAAKSLTQLQVIAKKEPPAPIQLEAVGAV